ncbi:MAG: ABC transporter ATP-binding protein [Bacillota bacterium]|jgi:branched-chain amino acid transport system ATP-binding protein|nr:ABC transporter ATP-binding protein [Bacillota bacterium]
MSERSELSVQDLTMRFGGLTAVRDFSLELAKGELVGLIGPNGAGKTTVFNVITGVYRPTSGKVLLDGVDITGWRPDRVCKQGIARTFQNIRLMRSLSVLDNVIVGHRLRLKSSLGSAILRTPGYVREERELIQTSLELLDSLGLVHYKDVPAGGLPYGEQRRVEIARALATRPRVLLLDEPAAGMNPQESMDLCEFIQKVRRDFNLTVLLIEHDMSVVMGICERIAVLDHGETIASGVPAEIQANQRVIEAYLGVGYKNVAAN